MKFSVNEQCISCGLCTTMCPEVFSMGDERAEADNSRLTAGVEEAAEAAMHQCPVDAIEKA